MAVPVHSEDEDAAVRPVRIQDDQLEEDVLASDAARRDGEEDGGLHLAHQGDDDQEAGRYGDDGLGMGSCATGRTA